MRAHAHDHYRTFSVHVPRTQQYFSLSLLQTALPAAVPRPNYNSLTSQLTKLKRYNYMY